MTLQSDRRKSGISIIGDLPWGSHFCQFYQTKEDLLDIFVPYVRAGLENNEFCVWVTSTEFGAEDVKNALKKAVPDFEKYAKNGQMQLVPSSRCHDLKGQGYKGEKPGQVIVSLLDKAVAGGFDGLRLACSACLTKEDSGKAFTCGTDVISKHSALAVFAYPRDSFDTIGLMEVVKNHGLALLKNSDKWEVLESSEARTVRDALKRSEEKLHSLFSYMSEGFAYHRIVLDANGKPCDYIFLEINEAFERLTGLKGKDIIGKKVTEALPGIEKDPTDWIGKYGKVALTGEPVQFESYSGALNKWFSISAFSPHKGYFAVTFSDITERKRYEEELIRTKQEWELTFDSVPDMIAILDTEHRIVRVNRPMAEQLGLKPGECVGLPCYKYVHGLPAPPEFCPHSHTLGDGCQHFFELFEARLGGDMLVSTTPILNKQGEITGSVHVARNISEMKKAEKALRSTVEELQQRETEVSALLKTSRAVMEQHDFKDTARLIFDSCKNLIGATAGYVALLSKDGHENEVLFLDAGGRPCTVDPSLPMPVRGLRGIAYSSGRTVYENDFTRSEWVKFMPEGHAALDNVMFAPLLIDAETVGILGLANKKGGFTDNDARMATAFGELASIALHNSRLFESLSDSEKRLNRSQKIAHLGSWELDLINNHLYWSDEVYRIFGLKPQEFSATYEAFIEAVHPEDRTAVNEAYSSSLRNGRDSYEIEHRVLRKATGEIRIVHEKCEHIRDEAGKIIRSIGMVHDITERKQLERELEKLVNELMRSNKELEQFAYIASHDLQEPLRMVSSYVQLLNYRYKGRLDKDADDFIGYVVNGASHMQMLLNDLLAYSRVGTRNEPYKLIDLKSAFDKALINLKVETDGTRAEITHETFPVIYADEVQMVQVFQNLLSNAMKFCKTETPLINVTSEMIDDEWVVRVKDNGIGIDPKYFDRIFQIFKRLHSREQYQGTGIGLAICKKIIDRHKGRIWVESEPGKGATFCFTIPVKRQGQGAGVMGQGGTDGAWI